jgi:hypothetical protein
MPHGRSGVELASEGPASGGDENDNLGVDLEEIVARYPALALAEEQGVEYIRTIAFRGPKRLMARLGSFGVPPATSRKAGQEREQPSEEQVRPT